jgi:hypothetical protein
MKLLDIQAEYYILGIPGMYYFNNSKIDIAPKSACDILVGKSLRVIKQML